MAYGIHPHSILASPFWSAWPVMKGILLVFTILLLCIYYLDAFIANPYHPRYQIARSLTDSLKPQQHLLEGNKSDRQQQQQQHQRQEPQVLSHNDIVWKLRPPPETPYWKKVILRLASNVIRLDCKVKGIDPPFCLCPKGGKAVLEAYVHLPNTVQHLFRSQVRVGKFGITTLRGPPAELIDESVQELYGIDLQNRSVGSAAIIYMFVEPMHRQKGIGTLALEVISTIHALQGVDFTVLVADDDGSGKLVEWYEAHGYQRAPKLQDFLGSPGGQFGISMIGPTNLQLSSACKLQWW